jgi:hypothetical protein
MAVHHPIALCPVHGLFPATAFAIENATVGLIDVATTCPHCGRTSEVIPGTYQAEMDRLNILVDPSISLLALGAIRKLAEQVKAGEIDVEEAKRKAEKIHPKAGRLFDIANRSDTAKSTLYSAIIAAAAVIAAAKISSSSSHTTVINPTTVIEHVITKTNEPPHLKIPRPTRPQKKRR